MSPERWLSVLTIIVFTGFFGCTRGCGSSLNGASEVLNADRGFKFPSNYPPDPGQEGRKTLEGIDSDHDGLRDDVQRWIYARYPNDESKRKALRQMALQYQLDMKVGTSLTIDQKYSQSKQGDLAGRCLTKRFPDEQDSKTGNMIYHSYTEMEYVKAKVLNIEARTAQFLKVDAQYDGMVFGDGMPDDLTQDEKQNPCDP